MVLLSTGSVNAPQVAPRADAATDPAPGVQPTAQRDGCVLSTRWTHVFPAEYLGPVYAQISAGPRTRTTAEIILLWGRWRLADQVLLLPGAVHLGHGGTALLFAKTRGVVDRNPRVELVSSVPVCVRFGTDVTQLGPVVRVVDANDGWSFRNRPYT